MLEPPSRHELAARQVLEAVDRVPGDRETTAFKQRARLHQARWRAARGFPEGTEPTRPRPDAPARPVGSRLEIDFAFRTGANFLTDGARAAAQHRMANPEPKQTLNPNRLYADLLSSMPTFEVRTLESFMTEGLLPTAALSAFRERYLW